MASCRIVMKFTTGYSQSRIQPVVQGRQVAATPAVSKPSTSGRPVAAWRSRLGGSGAGQIRGCGCSGSG